MRTSDQANDQANDELGRWFLALTREDLDRRDSFKLWLVNAGDAAASVRCRACGILDLSSGPMALSDGAVWRDVGTVGARATVALMDNLRPASDVIVYWTLELVDDSGTEEVKITEYREAPQYSEPNFVPLLGRDAWVSAPEVLRKQT